jgi:cysteine-rich repeat protein
MTRLKLLLSSAVAALTLACAVEQQSQTMMLTEEGPECVGARTPGFWCQNQDGHPELSAEEFQALAEEAAGLLSSVDELDTAAEVAAAVCDESNQLVRHLAATTLDIAANLISVDTPLVGEDFATVGDAWAEAVAILNGTSTADAEEVKDVLDAINNNTNTILGDECVPEEDGFCGDGTVDDGEECDDGNMEDGDGCSANCDEEEDGFCGDGVQDSDEWCDDGNMEDGDGCSSECELEKKV